MLEPVGNEGNLKKHFLDLNPFFCFAQSVLFPQEKEEEEGGGGGGQHYLG